VRVLIDATAMPVDRGGVARYVDELVRALAEPGALDVVVACQPRDADRYRRIAPAATIAVGPRALSWRGFRLLWEQLGLPLVARRHAADVVHSPHYTLPLLCRRRRVVTVHDVTFFSEPEVHRPIKRIFFRAWIRLSCRLADVIVTPSLATATELERAIGHPVDQTVVAPHGVDHGRFGPPAADAVATTRRRHGLDGDYVLFLGTIEPRKHVPALIRAHALLVAERAATPLLVLAGARGWETETERALAEHPRPDTVRVLGYVDGDDVVPLLGAAAVVAYPSSGEGFGLPVLEAMATGAAVLTTRRLAIPEVAGDAAAYCEPSSASIAAGLRQLLDDDDARAGLRRRALERAGDFSWQRSAAIHAAAYAGALARLPG
jgi:glycosyltransferase involved in cell wall biosynthesis